MIILKLTAAAAAVLMILPLAGCSSESEQVNFPSPEITETAEITSAENEADGDSLNTECETLDDAIALTAKYLEAEANDGGMAFYGGELYGRVAYITDYDEISAYVEFGEYIGDSAEKPPVPDAEGQLWDSVWTPDSELEVYLIKEGTPLYKIGNCIVAVFDEPYEYLSTTLHKADGSDEVISYYYYGSVNVRLGE